MPARRLLINSMFNMRELGGYPTHCGTETKFRRFLRSDLPYLLPQEDIDFLKNYGVKLVIDMRMDFENERRPNSLAGQEGIIYKNIPFAHNFGTLASTDFSPQIHYVEVMKEKNRVSEILAEFANIEERDAVILFNCHAGKDRTGIISMLLLMIVNVPIEDILADYQVTFTYMRPRYQKDYPQITAYDNKYRSDADWVIPLYKHIEYEGGIEKYLISMGLTSRQINILREKLIS